MVKAAPRTPAEPVDRSAPAPLPWLIAPLAQALQTQHGHALLLQGPQGVGQFELAMLLAQAWLCEADTGQGQRGPRTTPACGVCPSCRLVAAHSHPDLLVLLPEALRESLGWGGDAGEGADGDKAGKAKPSKEIKVEAVRAAVGFSQTTAARGRAKVVVVFPAERMNTISANTLLKTLEEPPGVARFVLGCAAPDALLPTVRSRCQALPMAAPDSAVAVDWLRGQGVADPETLLAATGGQPQDVLAWLARGTDAALWRQLPRQLARGEGVSLSGWPLPDVVEMLQKLCHDAQRQAAGAAPRYFPADALPAPADPLTLGEWARSLSRMARSAEHPWSAALALESLVSHAQQVLSPRAVRPPAARHRSLHSGE